MKIWLVMIFGALLTFLIRYSFIAIFSHKSMPSWLQRALRYVPPAVLSVIIFQGLLFPAGVLDVSPANPRLLAGLVAVLVAWWSRNALLTICVGMVALVALQWII